jgi:hypothetical protein
MVLVSLLAMMAFATTASANLIINGDFGTGDETGWTRWRAPWGINENWSVGPCPGPCNPEGCDPPCEEPFGVLTLAPAAAWSSFGWFQRIQVQAGQIYELSGCWCGDVSPLGWAEVMAFSCTEGVSDDDVISRIDTGNGADIAAKKDGWGLNPPDVWDCDEIGDAPYGSYNVIMTPTGPAFEIPATCNEIVIALKLGTGTWNPDHDGMYACFDNLELVPEPVTALLLGLPMLFLRRRRA